MENLKEIIKYWLLPDGVANMLREFKSADPRIRMLCRPNVRLKNIHQGKRCFILCNGPSVLKQSLLPLKNEIVFSVSNAYHHKDYLAIQPKYHCAVRISYNKCFHYEDALSWFKEMHSRIGSAELFLDAAEASMIKNNKLFVGRKINYFSSGASWNEKNADIIDISRRIPGITTVPILCIIIAIYMGFKDIYLIGVDHDFWKTGEYKHFFEQTVLKGKDESTYPDGKLKDPLYSQFLIFGTILRQYWHMHNIARANNMSIFNATEGGALEEFKRVKFESLF